MEKKNTIARIINCVSILLVGCVGLFLKYSFNGGNPIDPSGIILINSGVQSMLYFYGKSTRPAIQFYLPILTTVLALMAEVSLLI